MKSPNMASLFFLNCSQIAFNWLRFLTDFTESGTAGKTVSQKGNITQ